MSQNFDAMASDELLGRIADVLKAMADPTRLKIIHSLHQGERCVSDILGIVGGSQANVSKHLRVLRQAEYLTSRKDKGRVLYALADKNIVQVCDLMCGSLAHLLKDRQLSFSRFSSEKVTGK